MSNSSTKTAVVLMNLGGPESLKAVRPFLFRLFYDRDIIPLPTFFRFFLALFISLWRAPLSRQIYKAIGGKSPLLENTQKQAQDLEELLNNGSNDRKYRVFISMRYTSPFSKDALKEINLWGAEEIILLPLYPQYSKTTTGSSFRDFKDALKKFPNLRQIPLEEIKEYAEDPLFVEAHVQNLLDFFRWEKIPPKKRILFSAHSLPLRVIKAGDPYERQTQETVAKIVQKLAAEEGEVDFRLCYQSRVGPEKWLGPSLGEEIKQGAKEQVGVVVVPISFVSENSETLYELDILYKEMAEKEGVPFYGRVPTFSGDLKKYDEGPVKQDRKRDKKFIEALANMVLNKDTIRDSSLNTATHQKTIKRVS